MPLEHLIDHAGCDRVSRSEAAYAAEMSAYTDLSRPPLNQTALRRALLRPGAVWRQLSVVRRAASTNADLARAAADGAPEGAVLVAEEQTSGRGRLDRQWVSPPQAGLTFSVLLRPSEPAPERGWPAAPASQHGWLPLLAGVALADVARRMGKLDATLKWPNDLLVDGRKCAGILAEAVPGVANGTGVARANGPAIVIGIGLNVSTRADELPHTEATSLALAGSASVDREPLLKALLREFAARYADWRAAEGDPERSDLRADYTALCDTVGREVRVITPGSAEIAGTGVDIDAEGRLVVSRADGSRVTVAAGDVVHVR